MVSAILTGAVMVSDRGGYGHDRGGYGHSAAVMAIPIMAMVTATVAAMVLPIILPAMVIPTVAVTVISDRGGYGSSDRGGYGH
jgi:hypothetical protein